MLKTIAFYAALIVSLNGCGVVGKAVSTLDSSWADEQRVYRQAKPMPPLEIPANLARSNTSPTDVLQTVQVEPQDAYKSNEK